MSNRIVWIDGAKGIAILMIVLVHVAGQLHGLPGIIAYMCAFGNTGVQLFFIISAYSACMTNALPGRNNNVVSYYIKRFMRLAPLYWFGILLYFLMASFGIVYGGSASVYTMKNILVNIFLINNLFPVAQNSIVPGGWCISCFAFFYLLFPVLILFLRTKAIIKSIGVFVFGVSITFLFLRFASLPKEYVYWLIINQLSVFLIGMLYYKEQKWQQTKHILIQLWIAFAIFGFAAFLIRLVKFQYVYQHIFVSLGFIFLLNVLRNYEKIIPIWIVLLGKLSYPIFIIHLGVLWVILQVIGRQITALPILFQLLTLFVLVAFFSFLLALILNRFIEEPIVKYVNSFLKK